MHELSRFLLILGISSIYLHPYCTYCIVSPNILQEKEINSKFKIEILKLQEEINSLKTNHNLDSKKMKLIIGNLENSLEREVLCVKEEEERNENLRLDVEKERNIVIKLKDDIKSLSDEIRRGIKSKHLSILI